MADRIIKPDSGNVLELQDAGGTARMEINDGGTTLLKDEGGTTAISIAAAGDVTVTEDIVIGDGKYIGTSSTPSALLFNTAGFVTNANHPAFLAKKTGAQSSPADGATITWDTTYINQGSDFSTANNNFTAPVNGSYFFTWSIRVTTLNADNTFFSIYCVATSRTFADLPILPVATIDAGSGLPYWGFDGSTLVDMTANDTVHLTIEFDNTAPASIHANSHFSGFLVC